MVNSDSFKLTRLALLPLLLVVGVLPLVARVAQVPFLDRELSPFPTFIFDTDVFAWSKLMFLSFCGCLAGIVHILMPRPLKKHHAPSPDRLPIYLATVVMVVSALMATWWSKYRMTAIFGFPGHYEGLLAYLSYFLLFLLAFRLEWNRSGLALLITAFLAMGLVMGVLAGLQYFDLYQLDQGILRKLIFGRLADDPEIRIMWAHAYEMTATLNNPNMVGSFAAMAVPLTSVIFLQTNGKLSWFFLFLAGLFFFVALGCHSRAGILGITVALVCFSVVAWRCYGVNWARLGCLGFVYLALFLAVGGRQGGVYERIKIDGQRDLVSLFVGSARSQRDKGISPQAILVKSGILFCKSNFRNLILKPDGQGFKAMDGQGNLIPLVKSPSGITSLHPEYGDLNIELKMGRDGQKLVHVKWPPHDDVLALTSEGFRILAWGIPHESETPKVAHIFSRLDLFSNRAYIWSLSIPMLKDFSLVGQGFGAFALYFPQRDFNGKRNLYANHEIVIEKPHNMYLQYALGGGLPFLGFFLLMAFYICYRGAKTIFLNTGDNIFLPALLSACIGYLASGFFNDSTIFVAPLFWVLLGISASISVPRGRKVDALEDLP